MWFHSILVVASSLRLAIGSTATEYKLAFLYNLPEACSPVTRTDCNTGFTCQCADIQNLVLVTEKSLDVC